MAATGQWQWIGKSTGVPKRTSCAIRQPCPKDAMCRYFLTDLVISRAVRFKRATKILHGGLVHDPSHDPTPESGRRGFFQGNSPGGAKGEPGCVWEHF